MSPTPPSLQRHQPLKEQAYQALRMAILSGELAPGQRLIESQLAKDLQVSRTPIREALRLLQHEELVTHDTDHGLRVTTFSVQDAIDFYDCRIALEQLSVTAACQHATDTQIQELERIMQRAFSATKPVSNKSLQLLNFQLLDLDYRFHRVIAESSQNLQLLSILDQLFAKMTLLRIQTLQKNRHVLNICLEHQHIYEAIAQRNSETAIQAITEHLKSSKERVIRELIAEDTSLESSDCG